MTSITEHGPEILPQVIHLSDLLKWVRQGRVRIPNFQRDFVWDRQRMLDLFDSIRKQYPIGTLLFWKPTQPRPMRDHIGPLKIPKTTGDILLVLDGQQRLTTLAGVLLRGDPDLKDEGFPRSDDRDPERWDVCFDAAGEGGGVFVHPDPRSAPPDSYVRLPEMLSTLGILEAGERFLQPSDESKKDVAERFDVTERRRWVLRLQEAAQALQSYRVPVVEFSTDSLQLAVESFTRLNRQGRTVGPDEMFSALTYEASSGEQEQFHLSRSIDQLRKALDRRGFGPVERVVILRAVLAAADLDPYRTEWDRLGQELRSKTRSKLPDAVEEARGGLLNAVEFLVSEQIYNSRMLPYSMQLVALSAFFGRCPAPTSEQKKLLRRFLWASAFSGWFGRGNPARVRKLIEELRDQVPRDRSPTGLAELDLDAPADPFPDRYDLRSARVRALVCAMLREGVRKSDGTLMSAKEVSEEILTKGPSAFSLLCSSVQRRELRVSPANRVFDVKPEVRGQARNWIIDIDQELRDKVLQSHHIAPNSFGLLSDRHHDEFVAQRLETLVEYERRFMAEKGVEPPDSREPGDTVLDVDEQAPLSDANL